MIFDTCALLYLATGDPRLSKAIRQRIASATQVYYCAISSLEIAIKYASGKLDLPVPPEDWFLELKQDYQLTSIAVTDTRCFAAAQLLLHHRDPFDRLIIATALEMGMPIVTTDQNFVLYGVQVFS